MLLTEVTAATEQPVTLPEAKSHLRVDLADDDLYIERLIGAATKQVEATTRRALITQTWDLLLPEFPDDGKPIPLPLPPLQSVTSVTYTDVAGASQTWAATNYDVDTPSGPRAMPGSIHLAFEKSYPATRDDLNAVVVRFVAGYGDESTVPEPLKLAILSLVYEWYENRQVTTTGTIVSRFPEAAAAQMGPYRVLEYR